jgi:CBS-domain-containing membrane protein
MSAKPSISAMLARLCWCSAGAALGLGLALGLANPPGGPLFLAALGGSSVFLFGLTRAPAAQPRALFGGHLGGALIGALCFQFLGSATWVYLAAIVLTLLFMLLTGTVHPPAGANPLIMIHAGASVTAALGTVFASVAVLAAVAMLWSRLFPGMVRYPVSWRERSPASLFWGGWED